jgi:hypothetical protein
MLNIIPEEVVIIPLLMILLGILTPLITIPMVFAILNKVLSRNKSHSAITNILGIIALLLPLWPLFMDKFQLSILGSVLICLSSSIFVIAMNYWVSE